MLQYANLGSVLILVRDASADESADEASFSSQEIERGQQRQAENGEMIRLDTLEQMHAITLELVGADACRHDRTGRVEIGIEKRIAESTHGHARHLHRFGEHLAVAYKRNRRMQLMRLASESTQLRASSRNIGGLVEALLTEHQSLIGAEHQPSRHAVRNG